MLARGVQVLFLWPHPGLDYTPLPIVISSCGKMSVDLGHREPTSRGPWRPLHTPPCTGTLWVERSTPQVHVARTIWVPRVAALPASPKDDLARRVVRLRFCFTTPSLLSWKVDQCCKSIHNFSSKVHVVEFESCCILLLLRFNDPFSHSSTSTK